MTISENMYREIVETAQEGIWVTDSNFIVSYVNHKAAEMLGYLKEDLLGQPYTSFLTEEYSKLAVHSSINRYKTPRQVEAMFKCKDGTELWAAVAYTDKFNDFEEYLGSQAFVTDITELKLKEIALKERIKLEQAISESSRLVVPQDKANISEILKIVGEATSVNRTYVFGLREGGGKMDNLYEWCSHNTEPQIDLLQDLDSSMFPWWIKQLKDGNNIVFSDIENLPPEAVEERNILQEQDIKSIFVAPILSTHGELTGYIGFDDTERHREWSDEDAKVLRVIAEMIGMYWDRKNSEDQLKKSLKNTQSMINNHEAVMLLIEPLSGKILEANRAAISFYGYSKEELLNMRIQDINALEEKEVAALRLKALDKGQKYFTFPHRLKNGEIKIVDGYVSPIDYNEKKVLFSIIFDVTKREEIAKENEYLAYHDYLTGVYNRRYFEESFNRLTEDQNHTLSIIIGDINGLKLVNDSFGYLVGDELIKEVAKEIRLYVQNEDILARISGDQFAILIKDAKLEYVLGLNNLLGEKLEKFVNLSNNEKSEVYMSVSFGCSMQSDEKNNLSDLYEEAETFLYKRKFYNNRSTRSNLVKGMMSTLFQKSEREQKHSERVSLYCESIAVSLGWDFDNVNKIRVAGKLHDIGKIGVSEEILNKEGKLNEAEWEMMKQHTIKGATILEETDEYSDMSNVVAAHHERWDGTGYPKGLKGEEIPIMARIIAVADAYDAMTEQRTYRSTLSKEKAIAELIKCSGTQFDPSIVSVFVNIIYKNN